MNAQQKCCLCIIFDLLTCEGVFCFVHLTIGSLPYDFYDFEEIYTSLSPVSLDSLIQTSLLTNSAKKMSNELF